MPDMPIIDSHLHLVDRGRISYPWLSRVPKLDRDWTLADYDRLTGGVPIEGMVFVEVDVAAGDRLAEVGLVEDAAKADPRLRAMVACVAMDEGAATEAGLDALRGRGIVRGVRHLIQDHVATPGWCLRPAFVDGVRMLPARRLSFDICIVHPQMEDAIQLVKACPEVTFIFDHIGKPGIKVDTITTWAEGMGRLAALPNVVCKISGVATEGDHTAWREDQALPYILHALHVFGADRVMFGGDWMVSELATSYARWVALVDRAVRPFGSAFAERLWRGTATEVYRL
jgi:L-fuconolactonase